MNRAHHFLRFLILAVLIGLSLAAAARAADTPPAQIAVSPSKFELEIGSKPKTESVTLINVGKHDVDIQVALANWDLDESNRVRILEPDEQSLDQWIAINPLRFTVPAGGTQTVRFSVRPRVRPHPGEHRAMIYFNQVLPEESNARVRVKFSVGVAVYGFAGDVVRAGTLHDVSVVEVTQPVLARFDISSEGTAHVRLQGQYAVYPAASYPGSAETARLTGLHRPDFRLPEPVVLAGALPSRPVLPDTRRDVLLRIPRELPPGDYVLDLNGDLAGTPIDAAVPFTVPPPELVADSDAEQP